MISSKTKLCIGIGFPIFNSLGPIIHNSGLKAKHLDSDFLYLSMNVEPDKLAQFIDFAKTSNIRGITVTLPHKETIIPLLDYVDETTECIGAVNTVVNDSGILRGYNTDHIGAVEPLAKLVDLTNKKVAVIGAGGAAKAFAYGLCQKSADVTIFNRTKDKADGLAKKFGCKSAGLDGLEQVRDFEVICNASSIGFSGSNQQNQSPIESRLINSNQIIFDAIYSPVKTKLLEYAERAGATTISGTEMLLAQGFAQFKLYFNQEPPENEMRRALMDYLQNAK